MCCTKTYKILVDKNVDFFTVYKVVISCVVYKRSVQSLYRKRMIFDRRMRFVCCAIFTRIRDFHHHHHMHGSHMFLHITQIRFIFNISQTLLYTFVYVVYVSMCVYVYVYVREIYRMPVQQSEKCGSRIVCEKFHLLPNTSQ